MTIQILFSKFDLLIQKTEWYEISEQEIKTWNEQINWFMECKFAFERFVLSSVANWEYTRTWQSYWLYRII